MMSGAPPFQGFSFATPPPPQASSAAPPSPQSTPVAPPPLPVAGPAVPAGHVFLPWNHSLLFPLEVFKREGQDTETWSYWWKVNFIGGHRIPNSYNCLAQACDYPGKVSELRKLATVRRLHPNSLMCRHVSDYVKNSSVGLLRIHEIYKIDRKGERGSFNEPNRFMFWYGARPSSVPAILQSGLEAARVGGTISFADRLGRSQQTATENSKGRYLFVLAEVAPGRIYEARDKKEDLSQPHQGFDSVMTVASRVPDWESSQDYHGAVIPCGPTVLSQAYQSYDWINSDYILYDANRAIVRFIVECSRV